jgi:outer membrane biogenesis lipoprotein LolB
MKKDTNNSSSFSNSTDWKAKSIQRGRQFKALNKRIRELTLSRDNWKNKYLQYKQDSEELSAELLKIKKKLNEIIN